LKGSIKVHIKDEKCKQRKILQRIKNHYRIRGSPYIPSPLDDMLREDFEEDIFDFDAMIKL